MQNYNTLTYSETSKGWPSFYSMGAEGMVGMNNYFYSFKGGLLYRHNTNETRARFYDTNYDASITTVFNKSPLEAKLFKTLSLQSTSAWGVTGNAIQGSITQIAKYPDPDLQTTNPGEVLTGNVIEIELSADDFEQKEGVWYSYIRNKFTTPANTPISTSDFGTRSIKGIGGVSARAGEDTANCFLTFPADQPIPSSLNIGDYLYQGSTLPIKIVGIVLSIDRLNNKVEIDNDTVTHTSLTIADLSFKYYVPNLEIESHGILGHHLEITLTNNTNAYTELFAVESEIMKSYP